MWKMYSNLNAAIYETHEPGQHIYCKQLQQFQILSWYTFKALLFEHKKWPKWLETAFSGDIAPTKLLAIVGPMLVPVYGRRVLWKSRPSCHQLHGWLHRLSSGIWSRLSLGIWSRLLTNEPQVSNNKRNRLSKFLHHRWLADILLLIDGRIGFVKTEVLTLSQTFLKILTLVLSL